MSYILEALKKAQAERQLGNAPTIHAPQPVHVAPVLKGGSRKPLLIGLVAGVLVASAAAVLTWRQQAPVQVAAVAPAPVQHVPVAPPPEAVIPNEPVLPTAAPAKTHAAPAPVASPPHADASAPEHPPAKPQPVARAASVQHQAAPKAAAPVEMQAPPPAAAAPNAQAEEQNLRTLQELPEAIQREVPRIAFGGYMYSPNPADRLVLIDKALRHEGEEVAPGLVLEKLLPKAAVMNFRGYRYRVPY
ncbi:general secretion pathway protein GspB [Massilia horti]|uniref:Type II secretion system protein GspB C-terminal domain-containing protein n=1 Tax=Massilia horti TaxID=2562153 RepID=A0A4Y9SXX4_9BURK|nr:general secretion pathway protein GspB [Massilia horti]TFW29586.1 hypothetical protein E4O92_18770 [Massilia horti]